MLSVFSCEFNIEQFMNLQHFFEIAEAFIVSFK